MSRPLRLVFMGTPDFALEALKAISETHHEIVAVYSQPPRPKGRGQKMQNSPVHDYALEIGAPVYHPVDFKNDSDRIDFKALDADIAIVAAYGLILPQDILNAPQMGCVNIHASLLPRWRGASPIQHAIWKGDEATGVTLMQMEAGLDTGPMIAARDIPITADTNAADLHDDLAKIGAEMIVSFLKDLVDHGVPNAQAQDDDISNYAPMLSKDDGRIHWMQGANDIDRQIRALTPWPGVWCEAPKGRLKILSATLVGDTHDESCGTVIDKSGLMACGGGTTLRLDSVQPAGKSAMDFVSALNGDYITIGDILS